MKLSKQRVLEGLQELKSDTIRLRDLMKRLGLSRGDRFQLRDLLKELEKEGRLFHLRGNRYALTREMPVVEGRLQGHRDGYGFVIPDQADQADGGKTNSDIFIRSFQMGNTMHGDREAARVERVKPGGL